MFTNYQLAIIFFVIGAISIFISICLLLKASYIYYNDRITTQKELINIIEQQNDIIREQQNRVNNLETLLSSYKIPVKELN